MARAWQTLATVATAEGPLELRRRGESEFLIVIAGRVLMTSSARRSEEALSTLGCAPLNGRRTPNVLIGGLGMGYTLRAALDALPKDARVVVAELTPEVVEWCRGPLANLSADALRDRRVTVQIADIAKCVAEASPDSFDAILFDLYEGPNAGTQGPDDPFYGAAAIARAHAALTSGGVFAVWSEESSAPFERRLRAAGFSVTVHRTGKGGRAHVVYLGVRDTPKTRRRRR